MSYVHEPVTPSHAFSGCSRARPTGNDDVYQPAGVRPSHAFSGCRRARPTGNDDVYQSGERQALTRLQWL